MESLSQVGVQLLLFTLGLEFSLSKLRAVRSVALLGVHPHPWEPDQEPQGLHVGLPGTFALPGAAGHALWPNQELELHCMQHSA